MSLATYCVNTLAGLNADIKLDVMGIFLASAEEDEGPAAADEDEASGAELELAAEAMGAVMARMCLVWHAVVPELGAVLEGFERRTVRLESVERQPAGTMAGSRHCHCFSVFRARSVQ